LFTGSAEGDCARVSSDGEVAWNEFVSVGNKSIVAKTVGITLLEIGVVVGEY